MVDAVLVSKAGTRRFPLQLASRFRYKFLIVYIKCLLHGLKFDFVSLAQHACFNEAIKTFAIVNWNTVLFLFWGLPVACSQRTNKTAVSTSCFLQKARPACPFLIDLNTFVIQRSPIVPVHVSHKEFSE